MKQQHFSPSAGACVDLDALGLKVIGDGPQQAVCRRAVEHAQPGGICLGGKELEDGEHAPGGDVVAVQEPKCIGCSQQHHV